MNKLDRTRRVQIIRALVDGNSMRATARIADVSFNAVNKLLIDAGKACSDYQDRVFRNLTCKRLQLDEIWAFSYCKQRTVMTAKAAPKDAGDIWTWVALDADTKLVPSWHVSDSVEHHVRQPRRLNLGHVAVLTDQQVRGAPDVAVGDHRLGHHRIRMCAGGK